MDIELSKIMRHPEHDNDDKAQADAARRLVTEEMFYRADMLSEIDPGEGSIIRLERIPRTEPKAGVFVAIEFDFSFHHYKIYDDGSPYTVRFHPHITSKGGSMITIQTHIERIKTETDIAEQWNTQALLAMTTEEANDCYFFAAEALEFARYHRQAANRMIARTLAKGKNNG
jgi:hypothetical protein